MTGDSFEGMFENGLRKEGVLTTKAGHQFYLRFDMAVVKRNNLWDDLQ
jgi:hypothetical protein